eukprot:1159315-Pelagomonas_calceolata.AAC.5
MQAGRNRTIKQKGRSTLLMRDSTLSKQQAFRGLLQFEVVSFLRATGFGGLQGPVALTAVFPQCHTPICYHLGNTSLWRFKQMAGRKRNRGKSHDGGEAADGGLVSDGSAVKAQKGSNAATPHAKTPKHATPSQKPSAPAEDGQQPSSKVRRRVLSERRHPAGRADTHCMTESCAT